MHLPRGLFHSIKKKISLKLVLEEVLQSQFSGILKIFSGSAETTLVLRKGQVLLAEYGTLQGSHAYDELSSVGDLIVDSELSILSDTQLEMAVDYNRSCSVTSAAGITVFFGKKSSTPSSRGTTKITVGTFGEQVAKSPVKNSGNVVSESQIKDSPIPYDGDLNALDTMDLEKMAGKIRMNAKHIARNLDLDHLVVEDN